MNSLKFYDRYYENNYEKLITYYPCFYKDVFEMNEILKVHGKISDDLENNIEQVFLNCFIDTMDEETISKLEAFLGIISDKSKTLIEKRRFIKALLLGTAHIGQKEIKEIISIFTDGQIEVQLNEGAIQITVTRDFGDSFNLYDCNYILGGKIPAHLALDMVDRILPVPVFNDNRFIFKNFTMTSSAGNQYAFTYTGIDYRTIFRNYGTQLQGARLTGKHKLDGSWDLGTKKVRIFGRIVPQKLSITGLSIQNLFSSSAHLQFMVSAKQEENFRQGSIAVKGIGAKYYFDISGTITEDSRWTLNGDFILNGSKSLKQIYSKEDL